MASVFCFQGTIRRYMWSAEEYRADFHTLDTVTAEKTKEAVFSRK